MVTVDQAETGGGIVACPADHPYALSGNFYLTSGDMSTIINEGVREPFTTLDSSAEGEYAVGSSDSSQSLIAQVVCAK